MNERGPQGPLPTFREGDTLASRYRIERFLAFGGMGEVYEATDLELNVRLALKTIRPALAWNDRAVELFKREVTFSRQVTHVNVCRLFDVVRHQGEDGSEALCLTMELLPGETLAARLLREGPFSTADALPIVEQLAAGLAAAHRARIVHRDFKSANVMLVPQGPGGPPRAVIADFGLARLHAPEGADDVSRPEPMVGTSAYMAPEQVEGTDVTPAADVYALGVVMYEMVTGRRPFVGANHVATAMMRLQVAPVPPREHVPGLDPRWDAAILRCLERAPAARPAQLGELVASLSAEAPPVRPPRRPSLSLAALLLAAATLGPAALFLALRPGTPPAATPAPDSRRSVAVAGLRDLSGAAGQAWLGAALAEMLEGELAAGGRLRLVRGDEVARARRDLGLPDSGGVPSDAVPRLGARLGAEMLVVGSYLERPSLHLNLQLLDRADGQVIASVTESAGAAEADPYQTLARAARRLREALGAQAAAPAEAQAVRSLLPADPEASRHYAEGLAALRGFDAQGARAHLAQAAAREPSHALTHEALSRTWGLLGDLQRARAESALALARSASVPREPRLLLEARSHALAGERGKAIDVYRGLFLVFPDNLEYGLALADALGKAGRGQEVQALLPSLRQLTASPAEAAQVALIEARFGEPALTAVRAEQAARQAEAAGARHLAAHAWYYRGQATSGGGPPTAARAAFERAKGLYLAVGDTGGAAQAMNSLALLIEERGDLQQAAASYEEVIRLTGPTPLRQSWAVNNLAIVRLEEGRLPEALLQAERALPLLNGLGLPHEVARTEETVAMIVHEQGDLGRVRRLRERALETARASRQPWLAAVVECGLGRLAADRGELALAARLLASGLPVLADDALYGTEARVDLAEVALAQGRPADAEVRAREILAATAERGQKHNQARAEALLARALLGAGRTQAAGEAAARARGLAAATEYRTAAWAVAIDTAPVEVATGQAAQAAPRLAALVEELDKAGAVRLGLRARLALARARQASGETEAARMELQALAAEAGRRGFTALARQAAAGR